MIKHLKKKISILISSVFIFAFIIVLVFINCLNYSKSMSILKEEMKREIREYGIDNLMNGEKINDEERCVIIKSKDKGYKVISNYIEDSSDEEILEYIKSKKRKYNMITDKYIWIHRLSKTNGEYYYIVSNEEILNNAKPLFLFSLFAGVAGCILILLVSRKVSWLMLQPMMINEQKEKEFISNSGHELKTPLTVIKANIDILEKEIGTNKHIQYIRKESDRMAQLIQRIIDLSKLESPYAKVEFERINISEACMDIIYPFESVIYENGQSLSCDIEEDVYIKGDMSKIHSLVSILMDNAISYSKEKGEIIVSLKKQLGKVILEVTNEGKQMTEEECKMIFDKFYRGDKSRETNGNHYGLGLSIAYSIVAIHHGKISVESKDGYNRFIISIPQTF